MLYWILAPYGIRGASWKVLTLGIYNDWMKYFICIIVFRRKYWKILSFTSFFFYFLPSFYSPFFPQILPLAFPCVVQVLITERMSNTWCFTCCLLHVAPGWRWLCGRRQHRRRGQFFRDMPMYGEYRAWAGGAGGCFSGTYRLRNDLEGSHDGLPKPRGTPVFAGCYSIEDLKGATVVPTAGNIGYFTIWWRSHYNAESHHGSGCYHIAIKNTSVTNPICYFSIKGLPYTSMVRWSCWAGEPLHYAGTFIVRFVSNICQLHTLDKILLCQKMYWVHNGLMRLLQ